VFGSIPFPLLTTVNTTYYLPLITALIIYQYKTENRSIKMVSFKYVAMAMVVAQSNVLASQNTIIGYLPRSLVLDSNAIDLDVKNIESELADKTAESFNRAKEIYLNGGSSKNYGLITLTTPLTAKIDRGTYLSGKGVDGKETVGLASEDYNVDDTFIKVEYQIGDEQANYVRCRLGSLTDEQIILKDGCLEAAGNITVDGDDTTDRIDGATVTYDYTYNVTVNNNNGRTIAGFSTSAKEKMYDCQYCPYEDYNKFYTYYDEYDYAKKWTLAALDGTKTEFKNGDADFSDVGYDGRVEGAQKGMNYMGIWMKVVSKFEEAIDDCKNSCDTCNNGGVAAWDQGVAFFAGSLAGASGDTDGTGKLIHALGDKRCKNFMTCGEEGGELKGEAKVNNDLLEEFIGGQANLISGKCDRARVNQRRISQLMSIPLIQGTLRYAYINGVDGQEKEVAEGATFAAAVLPLLHSCSAADADKVFNHVRLNGNDPNFVSVKKAFERNYECLGISCDDIGGLWSPADDRYFEDANPCNDKSNTKSKNSNGLAVGIGVAASMIALASVAAVLFIRKREKSGNPVWEAGKSLEGSAAV